MSYSSRPRKAKKCKFFNFDGSSIEPGCDRPRHSCLFIHPSDPEWDTIVRRGTNNEKKRVDLQSSKGRGRGSRNQRNPDETDYHRRRRSRSGSPSRLRSPSRSPLRRASFTESSHHSPRLASASSITSQQLAESAEPLNKLSSTTSSLSSTPSIPIQATDPQKLAAARSVAQSTTSPPSFPIESQKGTITDPHLGRSTPISIDGPGQSRQSDLVLTSTPTPTMPSPGFKPLQPQAFTSAALPTPAAPSTAPATDPGIEEQKAEWKKRVQLLADYEQARKRVAGLKESCTLGSKTIGAHYFSKLSEGEQKRFRAELDELIAKRDVAMREQELAMEKIVALNGSWPVVPSNSDDRIDNLEATYREVVALVKELKEVVDHTRRTFINKPVELIKEFPKLALNLEEEETIAETAPIEPKGDPDATAMEIDHPLDLPVVSSPKLNTSRKRQRSRSPGSDIPRVDRDADKWLDRLASLENLASNLRNDILQHRSEQRDIFEGLVSNAVDEFSSSYQEQLAGIRETLAHGQANFESKRAQDQEAAARLRVDVEEMGASVNEMAKELSHVMIATSELEERLKAAKAARDESYKRVSEVEDKLNSFAKYREMQQKQIQTLEVAIEAYKSRPLSPPNTPWNPNEDPIPPVTLSYLISVLSQPIVQELRPHLQPILDELRTNIEEIVERGTGEVYANVWQKVQRTFELLSSIRKVLEEQRSQPRPQIQSQYQNPSRPPSVRPSEPSTPGPPALQPPQNRHTHIQQTQQPHPPILTPIITSLPPQGRVPSQSKQPLASSPIPVNYQPPLASPHDVSFSAAQGRSTISQWPPAQQPPILRAHQTPPMVAPSPAGQAHIPQPPQARTHPPLPGRPQASQSNIVQPRQQQQHPQ